MTAGQEQRDQHLVVLENALPPGYGTGDFLSWELFFCKVPVQDLYAKTFIGPTRDEKDL